MKILYIITGFSVGGAGVITVNLASYMQRKGHTVKVMYLSGKRFVQVPDSIEIINLYMKKNPFELVDALRKAKKIIKGYNPDLVHANMFHAILFSRLLRIMCPIKKEIDTVHTINIQSKIRMFLLRITDFCQT